MRFESIEIEDLISEISMGPFGSNIKVECFVEDGIPVLNGSNIDGYALNEDSFRYVTEEKADSLGKANAHRGDVVITHRGTLGQIAFIPVDSKYERYVISQSQFRVKFNEKVIPEYITYYFHTRLGQHKLLANASQVGVPALARATSTFKTIEIEIPNITTQKKIVYLLENIRRKISVNNVINKNLEEQAQAIFDSFYAQATDIVPFTSLIQILGGGTPKTNTEEFWNGDIPFFTPKDVGNPYTITTEKYITASGLEHCNSRLYPINTTFVTARGTVGKISLAGVPMAMNQSCYALASDKLHPVLTYLYTLKTIQSLRHKASGAVFDAIVTSDFKTEMINRLSENATSKVITVIAPMMEKILQNSIENIRLAALRDTLLPRLMSGEIDVSKIKI